MKTKITHNIGCEPTSDNCVGCDRADGDSFCRIFKCYVENNGKYLLRCQDCLDSEKITDDLIYKAGLGVPKADYPGLNGAINNN